jgi:twitching motility two-component system response regulator PilH
MARRNRLSLVPQQAASPLETPEKRELEPFLGTPRVTRVTVVLSHTGQDSLCANGRNRPKRSAGPYCVPKGLAVAIHKVLIVDDARPDLMNLEKIVSGAGYITLTAINGQQAVEMSKSQMPDVILMDVNMDTMDGFAATRAINGDASTKGIPVVLVTSKNQKADRVWAQMLGVKGYVTKPYTPDQILSAITACA